MRNLLNQFAEDETDVVRQFILTSIAAGTLRKGAKLPTERELAKRFSCSRSTVRKSLTFLEVEGTVVRKIGSGTYVAGSDNRREASGSEFKQISLNHLIEARLALEPQLAAIAIGNATDSDMEHLAHWVDRCRSATSVDAFEEADYGFHFSIAKATHNELLIQAYEMISDVRSSEQWRSLKMKRHRDAPGRRDDVCLEHEAIHKSIREGDPDAARRHMLDHLLGVRRNLFAF